MRKQLEGSWTLVSLTMHDDAGRSARIEAERPLLQEPDGTLRLATRYDNGRGVGEPLEEGFLTLAGTPFR